MVSYWKWQHGFDVLVAASLTTLAVGGPKLGLPILLTVEAESIVLAARAWVGPALTLLGMMSATTAFIFSVVDRSEFSALKALGVESQLWSVFAENILWLAIAAVCAAIVSFAQPEQFTGLVFVLLSFLFWMIVICISKFAWVMRQIISVRAK